MKFLQSLFALALAAAPLLASAEPQNRIYDFTDTYYRQNGIEPAGIDGRREAVLPLATADVPFFNYQRNVRMLLTLPAYDHSGHAYYFTVLGGLKANGFTNDAAGNPIPKRKRALRPHTARTCDDSVDIASRLSGH